MRYLQRAAIAFALLCILWVGCKSGENPAKSTTKASRLYAVSVDSAGLFRHGPQAGRDPDLRLPKDTVVRLIRPSFGYSKVQVITTGVFGYVSSEEIRPAPAGLLAVANTPPISAPVEEQFNLNTDDPRLIPPPEALPDPDLPAPAPEAPQ